MTSSACNLGIKEDNRRSLVSYTTARRHGLVKDNVYNGFEEPRAKVFLVSSPERYTKKSGA